MNKKTPPSTAKTSAEAGLLIWRTQESTRHLLMAMVYSLGIACATGLALMLPLENGHLRLGALVAHLVSGVLALVFFVPFLFIHLRDGKTSPWHLLMPWRLTRRMFVDEPLHHRVLGYLLVWCAVLSIASGLAVAAPALTYLSAGHLLVESFGLSGALLRVHLTFSGLCVFFVLLHFPKKTMP